MSTRHCVFRKSNYQIFRWLAPLAAAGFILQPWATIADTNRVGLLTIIYTNQCSGMGNDAYNDMPGWSSDGIEISFGGMSQYEVLQGETNLMIGNVISSTFEQNVSGDGSGLFWNGDQWFSTTWTYVVAYPDLTNGCGISTSPNQGTTNQFNFAGWWDTVAQIANGQTNMGNQMWGNYGETAAEEACAATESVLAITNTHCSWTNAFATNTHYDISWNDAYYDDYGEMDGTSFLTGTVAYVPDHPTVSFTATPTNGTAALTVQFGSDAVDSAANALTNWYWSFGDGAVTNDQNPSHRYMTNGTFLVTLTATNTNGVTVQGVGPTNIVVALPTVEFTAWPTNGWMPLVVFFGSPAMDSGSNAIQSWNWDFGDLTAGTGQSNVHSYISTKSKSFSPKLTVTNELGMAIVGTGPKISAVYPPIVFTASPTNGRVPMQVQFSAPGLDGFEVAIKNWVWNFGDGASSTLQNPTHTYTNTAIFAPALVATNVQNAVIAGLGPDIAAGCSEIHGFGGVGCAGAYDPSLMGFTNGDGINPKAGLLASGNRLYGVMSRGGGAASGTIFAVNTDGSDFTNVHTFSAVDPMFYTNTDGAWPATRLVQSGNTLYGTTSYAGTNFMGGGTAFRINTDGAGFTNLHNFGNSDIGGSGPNGLAMAGATLYGTAALGGSNGNGTVFKLNTDGSHFATLYNFSAGGYAGDYSTITNSDGAQPEAGLCLSGGVLYGTTQTGGAGAGTVIKLNTNGSGFTVLHFFTNSDGKSPEAELVLSGNALYGTTDAGGSASNGTVFKVNTDGSGFAVLYSFSTGSLDANGNYTNSDGAQPSAGLCLSGSVLFGATQSGGAGGSGTIFALCTNGIGFTNLYNFTELTYDGGLNAGTNLDGANPYGGLVLADGYLYGTACNGGSAGDGAVFALSVVAAAPPLDIQMSGSSAIIAWPSSETGWRVEQNPNLADPNGWTSCTQTICDDGTNQSVSILPTPGNLFFRLAK